MLLNAGLCCGPAARAKARWQVRAYAAFMSRMRWGLSRLYPLLCRVIAACLHGDEGLTQIFAAGFENQDEISER